MNTPQDRTFRQPSAGPTSGPSPPASAEDLAERASAEGQEQVQHYREAAADKVDALAGSIQAAAAELQDDDVAQLSRHVSEMAGSLSRLSEGLREKSVDQILRDVRQVARENPTLFIAGSIAIGFGIARFARASTRSTPPGDERLPEQPSRRTDWTDEASAVSATPATGNRSADIRPADGTRAAMEAAPGPAASTADAMGARTGTTASGGPAATDWESPPSTDAPGGRSQP